ncbi:MAG TPA: hypothetical protein VMW10_09175 [Alphaproteobacteria bacterium]|nr:hypothetical protein [Alphaproteobacteria bacterium]
MRKTTIRQRGFNDHADGLEIYDNPFQEGSIYYDLWDEGWGIREAQKDMFKEFIPPKKESCQTVCPHCGMGIKVTLK